MFVRCRTCGERSLFGEHFDCYDDRMIAERETQ